MNKQEETLFNKLEVPNEVTVAAMDSCEKGEDLHGPYDNVSDLMDELNN